MTIFEFTLLVWLGSLVAGLLGALTGLGGGVVLEGTRTRRISSVAYATEDRASEENTARARRFDSRWWAA